MPVANHEEVVNAPFDVIWRMLVRKVHNPADFVPGVTDVTILEDGDGTTKPVHRRMKRGEQVIEEHIYFPAPEGGRGVVDFRWVPGHPVYSGNVLNIVEALPGSPDTCRLRFELNWQPKEGAPAAAAAVDMGPGIVGAVKLTKEQCEKAAASAGAAAEEPAAATAAAAGAGSA